MSVVRSALLPGFSLRGTLGAPAAAAATLLATVIAPEGSGRRAALLAAGEAVRGPRAAADGGLVYTLEYVLTKADGRQVQKEWGGGGGFVPVY